MSSAAPRVLTRILTIALTGLTGAALAGCGAGGPAVKPEASGAKPVLTPGIATCTLKFGDDEVSVTLTETADAYTVAFAGEPITEENMKPAEGRATFSVGLWATHDRSAKPATLMTDYTFGELSTMSAGADDDQKKVDAKPTFRDGTFTATYPKPIADLATVAPDMWSASIYYDSGDPKADTAGYSQCRDGEMAPYEPLG